MHFSYFLGIIFALFSQFTFAQDGKSEAESYIRLADDMYNYGAKKDALENYKLAVESDPSNVKANFMVGKCYLETSDKSEGLKYFLKAYELNDTYDPKIILYVAECYHLGHNFDNAIIYYKKHRERLEKQLLKRQISKLEYETGLKDVNKKIHECTNGKRFLASPNDVLIENLGRKINSPSADYTPAISSDESVLIFTSRREGSTGDFKDVDNEYFEDIYIATKNEEGEWGKAKNIDVPVNTMYHDAAISLSPDGNELYLYKDEGKGDIYVSSKNGDIWSEPKPLKQVNSPYKETHLTSSVEGDLFIFSSDRVGTLGKMDLFMVEVDSKGKWGKAVPLGDNINTEYNEDGPFLDLDGRTLYFASEGHDGMGGFDLFKTVLDPESKQWTDPVNLGYPINTADDDIYFVLSGDGKHGYYSSFKDGGRGEKDIYIIDMFPENMPDNNETEEESNETTEETVTTEDTVEQTENVVENTNNQEEQIVTEVVENNEVTNNQTEEENQINSETYDNPIVNINKDEPERIYSVVLIGQVMDAETDTPVPNAKVEIFNASGNILIASLIADDRGYYNYEFSQSNKNIYLVSAEKTGYIYKTYNVQIPEATTKEQIVAQNIDLKKPSASPDVAYVLRNIYYQVNQAVIHPASIVELEKLEYLLLNNPTWRIELGGHTDNVGDAEANKQLSFRRAQAVVMYLINRGIPSNRVIPRGYGEEVPIASNDDEKEGRELNRRTEFRILSK